MRWTQRGGEPMSPSFVDRDTIDHLVCELMLRGIPTFPAGFEMTPGLRREDVIGRMLWRENLMSVRHRDPDSLGGPRPSAAEGLDRDVDAYVYTPCERLDSEDIEASVSTYDRNSREHPTYWGTSACRWVTTLMDAVRPVAPPSLV